MQQIWAQQALLPQGWARDVAVALDETGRIATVTPDQPPGGTQVAVLLPAPVNAHSHGFQRAMAGLTEARGPYLHDTFWTWRQLMFRFLDHLTPDHVQAITAFVQMEMLEAGYACNTEFHYLHHRPGGAPYDALAEMSTRIAAATEQSGIGLTLLPVHYQFGGCDGRPLGPGQMRFGNDPDRFALLHDAAGRAIAGLPGDTVLGVAPHSLRAVAADSLAATAALAPDGPVHMHLAEQRGEVDEVQAYWGQRPVAWLLDHMQIDARWCLIHCTQMVWHETRALSRTGAVAGLCPITESNLGDGIFDGVSWFEAKGRIAIGSDSNIRIALAEELRTLEYSQRLRDGTRAALATPKQTTGRRLYDAILTGGAQAAGRDSGAISVGRWGDLLALDGDHVDLVGREGDALLDAWIFAGDDRMVREVWSAGRHVVEDGQHRNRATLEAAYRATLTELRDVL